MIYFATCGRGIDKFVEEELKGLQSVCDVIHIDEGKFLFSVSCCDCCSRQSLRDAILSENAENSYYQIFDLHCKSRTSYDSELMSILKLKLIEKVYLLLFYKPIQHCQDVIDNISDSELLASIEKVDFIQCFTIVNYLDIIKKSQSKWLMCNDPKTCSASCSRQIERCQRWKRRKRSNFCSKKKSCSSVAELEDSELKISFSLLNSRSSNFQNDSQLSSSPLDNEISSGLRNNKDVTNSPSFRISCRIRGLWKKNFKPNTLKHKLMLLLRGKGIENWNENNPSLDVYVNLNDQQILIGVSLSNKPLSLRPYIPHITLRSSVCYIMTQCTAVADGEILLDPMCGAGTILLEAVTNKKVLRIIACDKSDIQLKIAQCNLRKVGYAEYLMADAESLPFCDESIDAIVCDFPFGKKYAIGKPFEKLLINVLKECRRVIKSNRKIVVLLSKEQNSFIEKIFLDKKKETAEWGICLLAQHPISLGLTPAFICVFCKMNRTPSSLSY